MKTIVLIPTKNEEWILESTLKNTAPYVDFIIVADQKSTDKTVEICKRFPNVRIIDNPYEGHSNKVRWLLLDESRKISPDGHNLIICIDADEMISPKAIEAVKNISMESNATAGNVFRFKWIQLWKNVNQYRDDGVWKDNFKNIAFVDNKGVNEYRKEFIINDHTTRVPDTNIHKVIDIPYPLLHFHFVAWKRNQMKQCWYRCSELVEGLRNAKRINNTYRVTLMPERLICQPVLKEWTEGLIMPENLENISSSWHLQSILEFFDKYGIDFFEELQIWHVQELHDEFVKRVGREPVSKVYPAWLVTLNEVKNKIRNFRF
ncbi:MAG: glycosyltransferase [Patescibacteria group bacterium]